MTVNPESVPSNPSLPFARLLTLFLGQTFIALNTTEKTIQLH